MRFEIRYGNELIGCFTEGEEWRDGEALDWERMKKEFRMCKQTWWQRRKHEWCIVAKDQINETLLPSPSNSVNHNGSDVPFEINFGFTLSSALDSAKIKIP